MRLSIYFWGGLVAMATWDGAAFAQVSAEDFLPPVRGGSTEVKQPDQVAVAEESVQAATAQDAANAAVQENVKQMAAQAASLEKSPEIGSRWIQFPSGAGIVATGMAIYQTMPNPTASRIAQRNAYVIAYTNAKAAMARQLGKTTNVGQTTLKTVAATINGPQSLESASSEQLKEMIEQAAAALLKGYVTYSIQEQADKDHPEVRTVYVTIVSTSKTQSTTVRTGGMQSVASLLTGIQNTLDEVKQGIVPPVGGRLVVVPGTGETAFIAFGSAVVQSSPSPALQAKMKLDAQKIAAVRARDALAGMLQGDRVLWSSGVSSTAVTGFEQTLDYLKHDAANASNSSVDEQLKSYNEKFLSSEALSETITSLRSGTLPPGIQEKNWLDTEGHWATSMVVYYPAVSSEVKKFADAMRAAQLVVPVAAPAATTFPTRTINGSVKPLSGGNVTPKNDL